MKRILNVIEETREYILKEMRHSQGSFYFNSDVREHVLKSFSTLIGKTACFMESKGIKYKYSTTTSKEDIIHEVVRKSYDVIKMFMASNASYEEDKAYSNLYFNLDCRGAYSVEDMLEAFDEFVNDMKWYDYKEHLLGIGYHGPIVLELYDKFFGEVARRIKEYIKESNERDKKANVSINHNKSTKSISSKEVLERKKQKEIWDKAHEMRKKADLLFIDEFWLHAFNNVESKDSVIISDQAYNITNNSNYEFIKLLLTYATSIGREEVGWRSAGDPYDFEYTDKWNSLFNDLSVFMYSVNMLLTQLNVSFKYSNYKSRVELYRYYFEPVWGWYILEFPVAKAYVTLESFIGALEFYFDKSETVSTDDVIALIKNQTKKYALKEDTCLLYVDYLTKGMFDYVLRAFVKEAILTLVKYKGLILESKEVINNKKEGSDMVQENEVDLSFLNEEEQPKSKDDLSESDAFFDEVISSIKAESISTSITSDNLDYINPNYRVKKEDRVDSHGSSESSFNGDVNTRLATLEEKVDKILEILSRR